eukprot:159512-Amphidinium_carterae.1
MKQENKRQSDAHELPTEDSKKRRGPISCRCCKKYPAQAVAWAEKQTRAGVEGPTGDKCLACATTWQKGFSWMSWACFCDHMATEDRASAKQRWASESSNKPDM